MSRRGNKIDGWKSPHWTIFGWYGFKLLGLKRFSFNSWKISSSYNNYGTLKYLFWFRCERFKASVQFHRKKTWLFQTIQHHFVNISHCNFCICFKSEPTSAFFSSWGSSFTRCPCGDGLFSWHLTTFEICEANR